MVKFRVLMPFTALLFSMAVASCGFTPVYAPGSSTGATLTSITVAEPSDRKTYIFARELEERLGPSNGGENLLQYDITTELEGLQSDTDRRQYVGYVTYRLIGPDKVTLASGMVDSFTGYSVSDGLFLSARQDALERLMIILADQLIRDLTIKLSARGGA